MTREQITLVKQSFEQLAVDTDGFAALFYSRLFLLDPGLKLLFRGDMKQQGKKLTMAIASVVRGLDRPGDVLPLVRQLAVRHLDYGVKPEHYPLAGAVLFWSLEQGLGKAFTADVRTAWTAAFEQLSKTMLEAAYGRAAKPLGAIALEEAARRAGAS
jgi:nitric oxide dioxygenase